MDEEGVSGGTVVGPTGQKEASDVDPSTVIKSVGTLNLAVPVPGSRPTIKRPVALFEVALGDVQTEASWFTLPEQVSSVAKIVPSVWTPRILTSFGTSKGGV